MNHSELGKNIRPTYGEDSHSIANAFLAFIKQKSVKQDIGISLKQLDAGEAVPLAEVMKGARSKYE